MRAVLFGSRARGDFRQGSDVDIALYVDPAGSVSAVSAALNDELLLPYKFDVLDYFHIRNPDLVRLIDKEGILIYEQPHT